MRTLLPLFASIALASFAPAQDCSTLAVDSDAGQVSISLSGDANAIGMLLVGQMEGSTSISFGMLGTLDAGLAMPFFPLPLGQTDENGDVSLSFQVPDGVPAFDLVAQGVTVTYDMGFSFDFGGGFGGGFPMPTLPQLSFCTSNVESFQIGN